MFQCGKWKLFYMGRQTCIKVMEGVEPLPHMESLNLSPYYKAIDNLRHEQVIRHVVNQGITDIHVMFNINIKGPILKEFYF